MIIQLYNLHRQVNNTSAFSSGNFIKCEYLTGNRKKLLEKAATVKKRQYSPLDCDLRKEGYQGLSKFYKDNDEKKSKNNKEVDKNKSSLFYI